MYKLACGVVVVAVAAFAVGCDEDEPKGGGAAGQAAGAAGSSSAGAAGAGASTPGAAGFGGESAGGASGASAGASGASGGASGASAGAAGASAGAAGASAGAAGATGGQGGEAGGAGGPAACLVYTKPAKPSAPLDYKSWACEQTKLCDEVRFSALAPGEQGPIGGKDEAIRHEADPAATACFLSALRDGKVGKLTLRYTNGGLADYSGGFAGTVYALGGGVVLYEATSSLGCCGTVGAIKTQRLKLKDAAYFDACAAETDVAKRGACVLAGTDAPPPWSTGTCDDAVAACP